MVRPGLCRALAAWVGLVGMAAQAAAPLQFAQETPVAVQVSLWKPGMRSGLAQPVYHGFMAQVKFSGEPEVVTCSLRMPTDDSRIAPGESAEIALRCTQPFRVAPGQPDFKLYAKGRPIGQGRLQATPLQQVMNAASAAASQP
ncbi:hypothetical protein KGA65_06925 [Ideonella sp. B7]|uniref:hypothetical protein n=1 Tax=Ideonella benzenivorans TaxID=2831643 RepID=UPI001CED30C6|nr:hypothetical protein [Ideonella benzenivorans]MCA6216269.1 hypothetical protein [Ideonella benzenivorans]